MEEYRQESLKRSRAADIVPNEEKDGSLEDWIKTEATFNYKLPCDINKTVAVAVVIHGVNRMDELEENDEGDFVYARDMSIAFPRMEELCIAIAIPKSGISTTWKTDDTTANPPLKCPVNSPVSRLTEINPAIAVIFSSSSKAEITLEVSTPKSLPITTKTGFLTASLAIPISSIHNWRKLSVVPICGISSQFNLITVILEKTK
jgi:hypothetical protein